MNISEPRTGPTIINQTLINCANKVYELEKGPLGPIG